MHEFTRAYDLSQVIIFNFQVRKLITQIAVLMKKSIYRPNFNNNSKQINQRSTNVIIKIFKKQTVIPKCYWLHRVSLFLCIDIAVPHKWPFSATVYRLKKSLCFQNAPVRVSCCGVHNLIKVHKSQMARYDERVP